MASGKASDGPVHQGGPIRSRRKQDQRRGSSSGAKPTQEAELKTRLERAVASHQRAQPEVEVPAAHREHKSRGRAAGQHLPSAPAPALKSSPAWPACGGRLQVGLLRLLRLSVPDHRSAPRATDCPCLVLSASVGEVRRAKRFFSNEPLCDGDCIRLPPCSKQRWWEVQDSGCWAQGLRDVRCPHASGDTCRERQVCSRALSWSCI